jgi:hypothetical protein
MTSMPQMDCCTMLGIDPKTLRNWLRQAHMQFAAHPTDARLKCLTAAQVQQLATLHGRPLPVLATARPALPEASPALMPLEQPLHPHQASEAKSLLTAHCAPVSVSEAAELMKRLADLERAVSTMQEQLTHLALELLRERQRPSEQRMAALEAHVHHLMEPGPAADTQPETNLAGPAPATSSPGRRLLPAEQRARSRVIPLIEYGAQGGYVLVCPQEGALLFAPDSTEWFDWLGSLTSFRFVGPHGRFTAYRDSERGQRTRSWRAHRYFHGRNYKHYLGTTDHLTIAHLEQVAAKLQAELVLEVSSLWLSGSATVVGETCLF